MRLPAVRGFAVRITPDTQVGHYGAIKPASKERRDTDRRCPLCDGRLVEPVVRQSYRVVKIERGLDAIAEPVPETHVMVECHDCEVGFTLLRERI